MTSVFKLSMDFVMTNKCLPLFFLLAIFAAACSDSSNEPSMPTIAETGFRVNGNGYSNNAFNFDTTLTNIAAKYNETTSLIVNGKTGRGDEEFTLAVHYSGSLGTYSIPNSANPNDIFSLSVRLNKDGEQQVTTYIVVSAEVTITRYDELVQGSDVFVEGTFTATLKLATDPTVTLTITDGRFKLRRHT